MHYDKNFLLQLDQQKNKTIYARITALTLQELPVETIEGRVTQGSINLDGASAVRRTCSLTIVAPGFDYSNYLWGFNTKFKLEIGVENKIDSRYEDIIWFKQGTYVISSFNTSKSSNNFTITIQGKDKMSRLNGDLGGTINSSVDFGTIEEETPDGIWTIRKIPIHEIIKNMVHQYAGEPLHNIIINDLPEYGLELMEYRYDVPMYLYKEKTVNGAPNAIYTNVTLDGTIKCSVEKDGQIRITTLDDLKPTELDMLVDPLTGSEDPATIRIDGKEYIFAKIEYGQTAGYRQTPLTYAGDLIANVGETVVSVLDKIKNMLGEFEYFYDLDGHFVFQQKQSFVNTIYSPVEKTDGENDKEQYIISQKHSQASQYFFKGGELVTTFNNNPNIANLKNDYSIWGQRNAISGAQIPVHLRYAIDKKPIAYTSIKVDNDDVQSYNDKYGTQLTGQNSIKYISNDIYVESISDKEYQCDWREVIYQMALDYYKYNHLDDFEIKVAAANPDLYPFGITGYEQYYIDLQGFWRDLYDPQSEKILYAKQASLKTMKNMISLMIETTKDNERLEELQKQLQEIEEKLKENQKALEEFSLKYYTEDNNKKYWNKNVYEHPELLNFWFDFLDTEGELNQFNVQSIGSRPKAINDTNIRAIYFTKTPDLFFVKSISDNSKRENGYRYIQVPDIDSMFSISAQGISAKSKLDELIYQHGYVVESATINCIPIYYLQPNTRVHITDQDTKLDGDYIVSKITIPLTHNGTMSLTATKAAEEYLY